MPLHRYHCVLEPIVRSDPTRDRSRSDDRLKACRRFPPSSLSSTMSPRPKVVGSVASAFESTTDAGEVQRS